MAARTTTSGHSTANRRQPRAVARARRARARALAVVATVFPFAVVAVANLAGATGASDARRAYDLSIYLHAARDVLAGASPYVYQTPEGLGFTYPPFALLPFLPLSQLPIQVVWTGWVLVVAGLCAFLTQQVARLSQVRPTPAQRLLVASLVAVTEPVSDAMWLGQVSPFAGAAAFLAVAAGGVATAGWAGVGAAIKVTPVTALAGLWTRERRWARLGWAIGAGAALTALGHLVLPAASTFYWTAGLFEVGRVGQIGSDSNTSLAGLLAHVGIADGAAVPLGAVLSVAGVLAWYAVVRRRSALAPLDVAVVVGAATVLASPVAWSHHALAVSLGWALLALRGWWRSAITGAVAWALPLFLWANDVPQWLQLPVQAVRPLSIIVLVVLLTRATSAARAARNGVVAGLPRGRAVEQSGAGRGLAPAAGHAQRPVDVPRVTVPDAVEARGR